MAHTSASTKRRGPAYAPSVVANRKPKGDPTALREVLIRDLTSAEVEAIDAALDAHNAAIRATGNKASRSSFLAAWIRERLADAAKKGGSQ